MAQAAPRPLVVDLDGTLVRTDTLHELALALVRKHPMQALCLPFWLLRGKAHLKQQLARRVGLDASTLPYNQALLEWLVAEHEAGRELVLCTAADERVAQAIARHLGIFSKVLASDGQTNLAADKKAACLLEHYGPGGFDYVGNSHDDVPVWREARHAIVVNASPSVLKTAQSGGNVAGADPARAVDGRDIAGMLRVHQWLKNLLLFVPLLAAHQLGHADALGTVLLAALAFSLCASAVYIGNDLLDLESDRRHPRKRLRPFANGRIPVTWGVLLAPLLSLASLALALAVGPAFLGWLAVYLVLTCWYSLRLKRLALLDCMTLASLYVLRIVAGASATGLTPSDWLLAVSGFVFLSLSFLKRYTELLVLAGHGETGVVHGRGYTAQDGGLVLALGVAAGYASAVVLALYLHGDTVQALYRFPEAILLTVAVLVYWISWMWLQAHRGEMHDDPVFFAIKDKTSLCCGAAFAASLALGTFGLPW
jgi:4-hydroxybenzoate polyprenyltransferase/phosphoserine phosphatase